MQVTGNRSLYRTYWQTGDAVYVRVQAGSPESVLLAAPNPWAEAAALFEYGQRLTVLDESAGDYVRVRTWGLGVDIEGWVTRAALGTYAPPLSDAERQELEEAGAASRSRMEPNGEQLVSPELDQALDRVSEHETDLNRLLGGDPFNPDPALLRARFRAFGEQGGLLGD
ncbi:MAG: hypothetical protein H6841_09870 [Planctomycetes bacterium]|nr:hypothetical protein [Planctomycetota bacterium]MCB9935690.1 hypothetical protein [Planctomycetota bacterium]